MDYALYTTHERPFFFNQSIFIGENFFRFEVNTVLAISNLPNGWQPLIESERRILKDSSDLDAELAFGMPSLALPNAPFRNETDFIGAASRTTDAIRPAPFHQVVQTVIGIGEIDNRVF